MIKTWFTAGKQRHVVDGEISATVQVDSGALQDTVFGPLMLLLFFNVIGDDIVYCSMNLFADDYLLSWRILSA